MRQPKDEAEKEEAYQAWLKEDLLVPFSRFEPIGMGPLIRDSKTDAVYDGSEFLMRKYKVEMAKTE